MASFEDLLSQLSPSKPSASSPGVDSFVEKYAPLAEYVSEKTGNDPSLYLAQWGLETGWGRSVIPGTNNLGNIKDFSGSGIAATDNMTGSRDKYRAYADLESFGDDFTKLLSNRRYDGALGVGSDMDAYATALKRGGYAEDKDYVAKLKKAHEMIGGMPSKSSPERDELMEIATAPIENSKFKASPKEGFFNSAKQGVKVSFEQLPQLFYGLGAFGAAGLESMLGEGGISTALKNGAVNKYQEWGKKIQADSTENYEWDKAYGKAQSGDLGALVDFLGYGIGYGLGQGAQLLATAGVGGAVAKTVGRSAVEKMAAGLVEKEAIKIAAGKEVTEAVTKQAVSNVARDIGVNASIGASAFGMEGGEIGGDLVSDNRNRVLTGSEIVKALGATTLAAGFEFAGDKIGLGALSGKLGIGKEMTGLTGRAVRGVTGGIAAAPGEFATEYMQTGAEEWGKGKEENILPWNQSEEAQRQAINAGALGAVGGGAHGMLGGVITSPIAKAKDVDEAIDAAQQSLDASGNALADANAMIAGITDTRQQTNTVSDMMDRVPRAATEPEVLQLGYQPGTPLVVFPDGTAMTRAEYEQEMAKKEQSRLDGMVQDSPLPGMMERAVEQSTPIKERNERLAAEIARLRQSNIEQPSLVVHPSYSEPVAQKIEPTNNLSKVASWVIRNKETGEIIMETFDRKKVDALNTQKYEAVPIQEHLGSLSRNSNKQEQQVVTNEQDEPVTVVNSREPTLTKRDDLVGAIMRVTGGKGISSGMAQTITGDKAGRGNGKLRGLFTNGGTADLGDTAMLLREEEGYDVRDGEHLADLIREASAGNMTYSMERMEREASANAEKEYKASVNQRAAELGLKKIGGKRTLAMVEADIAKEEQRLADMESKAEREAILAADAIDEAIGHDMTESDFMRWMSQDVFGTYTQEDIDRAEEDRTNRENERIEAQAIADSEEQAQGNSGQRNGDQQAAAEGRGTQAGESRTGEGFGLTGQTNTEAAAAYAQQNDPAALTKQEIDTQSGAFSLSQQSQPKPQGVQTGLFTADGRVSSDAKHSTSRAVTSEEKENLTEVEAPELHRATAAYLKIMERLLGKKIKWVTGIKGGADGMVNSSDTIYLSAGADGINRASVFGHEFWHTVRMSHAVVWQTVKDVVAPMFDDAQATTFFRDYFRADKAKSGMTDEQIKTWLADQKNHDFLIEEFISDLGGNRFTESDFWQQVFAKMEEKEGHLKATTLIRRFVKSLVDAINKLLVAVRAQGFKNADNQLTAEQLNKVKSALTDAMAEYLDQTAYGQKTEAVSGETKESRSAMKDIDANIRRGEEALAKAIDEKTTVHRAMFRNGLGWVDFVWGDTKRGIQHIYASRMHKDDMSEQDVTKLLGQVVRTIASGEEIRRSEFDGSTRVVVEKSDVEAILVKNAGSNTWLLNGWNVKNPDATKEANDSQGATQRAADSSDGAMGAGFSSNIANDKSLSKQSSNRTPDEILTDAGITGKERLDAIKDVRAGNITLEELEAAYPSKNPEVKLSTKRVTETPEFKRWFGDSKVVDADGKPLVVYHGTTADINAFDAEKIGESFGLDSDGFFFTNSAIKAARYADTESVYAQAGMMITRDPKDGANIIPAYLSIHNPLTIEHFTDAYYTNPQYAIGDEGISVTDYFDDNRDSIIRMAKKNNNDGVLFKFGDDLLAVAFEPTQIKSAIGNNGQFDPENADIRYSPKREQWHYSQLSSAVEQAPDKVFGPAQQVKLWIQSNKSKLGIKDDEIQWTGINDYLDLQGKNRVSKDDVLNYLKQNGVQVEEVVKGEPITSLPKGWTVEQDRYGNWQVFNDKNVPVTTPQRSKDSALSVVPKSETPTKYSKYVLPGGDSYRELLLTLPEKEPDNLSDIAQRMFGKRFSDLGDDDANAVTRSEREQKRAENYRSSHWDEPNILAHVRFNDRTDADGSRVLFIEEMQSDWQQNYRGGKTAIKGPFITKTEATVDLALKRMIAYAIEHGYDKVAFVNGEQSADRYDLSKQVDRVKIEPMGFGNDNELAVTAYKDGDIVIDKAATRDNLGDMIGKELASKAIENIDAGKKADFSGVDLKVGGSGMKTFYDQIVPQRIREVLKKVGGGKVESIKVRQGGYKSFDDFSRESRENFGESSDEQLRKSYDNLGFGRFVGADQIGFTITDSMREKVGQGLPLFSTSRIIGDSGREHTPEQLRAFKRTGRIVNDLTQKERIAALWQDAGKKLRQGIVDQFDPVKDISEKGYTLLRLAKGATGAFEAMLHHGKLSIRDGAYDADTSGGVMEKVFYKLGKESTDFLYWIAGNRAERLKGENRENLFSDEDIKAYKSLSEGKTDFDYTIQTGPAKGKVTRERSLIYPDAQRVFNEFNKNVLDMAEQSGLIDGDSRKLWESEFYVPFYRVAPEDDGGVRGMNIKGGVVRQEAFKKLKGGTDGLNDLLSNTLTNWAHLIDAAAKNRAAKETLQAAERLGAARLASHGEKKTVWHMDKGQKVEYKVDDPYLMEAISALEYAGLRGGVMDVLSTTKHWLTFGVTSSPFFKVRNLIRDSVQAIATGDLNYNPLHNLKQGYELTNRDGQEYVSALAGGGLIRFGSMLESNEASRTRKLIEMGADPSTILDSPEKVNALKHKMMKAWDAYNELGNRGEEINRMALYHQLMEKGYDHATASLMARDLMDFSMQGTFTTIRFLTQVVPFFNARLQGLYKLGRAAKEDPARFATVLGATALFSLALLANYHDDDDWKKREDWDRDNYWWMKFGGEAYRIPKPFEIGAIATMAERSAELLFDNEMTGERFRKRMLSLIGDQLSMNPTPQLIKPIVDIYANKDSFSGRPIETMGMEKLDPDYRFKSGTSMVARGISTAGQTVTGAIGKDFFSPVQVDHLLRGYFGWISSFAVGGADIIIRSVSDQPEKPASDYIKVATGGMVSQLDGASSRYVSQMYEQAKELEQAHGTYRQLMKDGKLDEAKEYADDNKDKLMRYRQVEDVKRAEARLNERIRMIERSNMSADDKRTVINSIRDQQDKVARRVAPGYSE